MEHILTHIYLFLLFLGTLLSWINLIYRNRNLNNWGQRNMSVAFACITIFLLIRWFHSNHLPFSNLYESFLFISWNFSLMYILLNYKDPNNWLSAITTLGATLISGFAILGIPKEMQQFARLVPALQSHWLMMHVSTMLLSYATLLCGSLLAITLLVVVSKTHWNLNTEYSYIPLFLPNKINYSYKKLGNDLRNINSLLFLYSRKEDLINQLDLLSSQTIRLGFLFLTIGIISGAVWANETWGSYWSWDPKETWALITWLIYANYLHTRITKGWHGKISAIVAALGSFSVWICYLGINLSGIGLHSYGWII
uniref:Cytochrome c biogenesis protein CcsA n=1 Tax=Psilotum nudum TaxID=3240 RepID=Q8WHX9_PSINU|nr:cytochrome c biogenesis protein [Psilotum nudum]BAB84273.1 cytochrome c biosynthesis protein [Psilotum nudum]